MASIVLRICAAIEGFAEGHIELPAPKDRNKTRGADRAVSALDFGFDLQRADSALCTFTLQGLIDLLGINEHRMKAALRNLKLVNKEKVASVKDY